MSDRANIVGRGSAWMAGRLPARPGANTVRKPRVGAEAVRASTIGCGSRGHQHHEVAAFDEGAQGAHEDHRPSTSTAYKRGCRRCRLAARRRRRRRQLQEIKCTDDQFPRLEIEDRQRRGVARGQEGFNGVAMLSQLQHRGHAAGCPGDDADTTSRWIEAVSKKTPCPSSAASTHAGATDRRRGRVRLQARLDGSLRARAEALLADEECGLLSGDCNVIPEPKDCWRPCWPGRGTLLYYPRRPACRRVAHLDYRRAARVDQGRGSTPSGIIRRAFRELGDPHRPCAADAASSSRLNAYWHRRGDHRRPWTTCRSRWPLEDMTEHERFGQRRYATAVIRQGRWYCRRLSPKNDQHFRRAALRCTVQPCNAGPTTAAGEVRSIKRIRPPSSSHGTTKPPSVSPTTRLIQPAGPAPAQQARRRGPRRLGDGAHRSPPPRAPASNAQCAAQAGLEDLADRGLRQLGQHLVPRHRRRLGDVRRACSIAPRRDRGRRRALDV